MAWVCAGRGRKLGALVSPPMLSYVTEIMLKIWGSERITFAEARGFGGLSEAEIRLVVRLSSVFASGLKRHAGGFAIPPFDLTAGELADYNNRLRRAWGFK